MAKLIRFPKSGQAQLVANDWQVFRATEGEESAALPQGKVIVPFAWWLTRGTKEQHQARAQKVKSVSGLRQKMMYWHMLRPFQQV